MRSTRDVESRHLGVRSDVGLRDGARAMHALQPDSPMPEWMVPAATLAIYQHRRRIDELLTRVGPSRRSAVEMAVSALLDERADVASLVARVTESCRDGDRPVQMLVEMLATPADARRQG